MSITLSPELKNYFISSARFLREGNEQTAFNHFNSICTQNPAMANQVYTRLWEAMGQPHGGIDFGRAAFWNQQGQTAPLSKKTKAIERVYKTLFEQSETPLPPPAPLPVGAKANKYNMFVDCGFDPRFSFDGNYLLPTKSFSLNWLCKKIGEWTASVEFVIRAYLSLNPEERAMRQMILSCSKTQSLWSYKAERAFIEETTAEDIYHTRTLEHEFLNKASEFHQMLYAGSTGRLYPSELLHSLHCINKPQTPELYRKEFAHPRFNNLDLTGAEGLWRLNKEMYRDRSIGKHAFHYVPHYIFIHATEKQGDDLKTAMREYRSELASLITDQKCARSFELCKQRVMPKMEAFHTAWENYVNSHELLQEANAIFSKDDYYKATHDYHKWEMKMFCIPFFSSLYAKYNLNKYNENNYWHNHLWNEGYSHLKQTVDRDFSPTHTAHLRRAYSLANSRQ